MYDDLLELLFAIRVTLGIFSPRLGEAAESLFQAFSAPPVSDVHRMAALWLLSRVRSDLSTASIEGSAYTRASLERWVARLEEELA